MILTNLNLIGFTLLLAMGLQNSLVTKISNATLHTTHLTGLFTNLGIELSQLFFYREASAREKLFTSIKLRLTIISFFFAGGIFYSKIGLHILLFGVFALIWGFIYDSVKLRLLQLTKKYRH